MPRDAITNDYSPPASAYGQANKVLWSAEYNSWLRDFRKVLNDALPIEFGGTGETRVEYALSNIGGVSTYLLTRFFTGRLTYFAMATAPTGWLLCDGSAVNRQTYRPLYLRIGTRYGAGDGTTTFNLPDLRGYFIRGLDMLANVDPSRTLGSTQGDANGGHGHTAETSLDGDHNHNYHELSFSLKDLGPSDVEARDGAPRKIDLREAAETSESGEHTHVITLASTGSENRPKNVALLPCIKT